MSVIYIVLPLAIVLAVAAVTAFAWAVRSGQMDDLRTPALRILHDDLAPQLPQNPLPTQERQIARESEAAQDSSRPSESRDDRERMSSTFAETPVARARLSQHDA